MSFKNNYIRFTKKFGGTHALIGKGLTKANVNSIMAGSMPLADTAFKVAKVLGVTVEDLVGENKTLEKAGGIKESLLDYEKPEELHEVDKLLEVLRDGNDEHHKIITHTISVLCGDKLWRKQGKPERRKTLVPDHGKPERRLKIHAYS